MPELPTTTAEPISPRDISVVVPVRDTAATLARCLDALRSADPPPGEIIVVVDGADDNTASIARSMEARVISLPVQRGAPAARNAGAGVACGSILLFVDADVIVASDAAAEVARAFTEHPEWSAVFGSYDDAPGAENFIAQYKGLLNHFVHQNAGVEAATFWTGLGAIRKDILLKLGGFDETQRLEDVELGYRMRAGEHRIGIRRSLLGKHLKRWTAASLIRSDVFDRAVPWTLLMLRYPQVEHRLNVDRANQLSLLCMVVLCVSSEVAWWAPAAAVVGMLLSASALLWLNRRLYGFFLRRRGGLFLGGAIAWHWLYFLYGGIAFGCGVVLHFLRRRDRAVQSRTMPATLTKVAS